MSKNNTPWTKEYTEYLGCVRIFDADGLTVGNIFGEYEDFIVRACNAHDDLLAACDAAYKLLKSVDLWPETEKMLEEAIKLAKGAES